MFYRGKTVVVVGGGNTAVSDVLYLSRLCEKVYLVHRRDALRASKVYLDPLQKAENVEFVWDSEVKQLLRDQAVTGVRVRNKKTGEGGTSPAAASLWRWVICPIRSCTVARWSWMRPGMSWPTRPPRPTCPGCSLWGTCGRSPCARWSPPPATGAVAAHFIEEYQPVKNTASPGGRVFAWVKKSAPAGARFFLVQSFFSRMRTKASFRGRCRRGCPLRASGAGACPWWTWGTPPSTSPPKSLISAMQQWMARFLLYLGSGLVRLFGGEDAKVFVVLKIGAVKAIQARHLGAGDFVEHAALAKDRPTPAAKAAYSTLGLPHSIMATCIL